MKTRGDQRRQIGIQVEEQVVRLVQDRLGRKEVDHAVGDHDRQGNLQDSGNIDSGL